MVSDVFLTEVIATRLSHDLAGNIGAVANAMELLNDSSTDDDNKDILEMLNYSSMVLTKRIKFLRLCFGLANNSLKSDELKKITEDYFSTIGNPQHPNEIVFNISSPEVYKIVLPAIMMMADTFAKNGKITVEQTEHNLVISAQSIAPLDDAKLRNIDLILHGKLAEDNQSCYAPLYYLLNYLSGSDVPVKRIDNALVIGD